VANKCVAEELERTSNSTSESATKSTKRVTYENYTPKEKAETSCYAWLLCKFIVFHEILCLENLELYGTIQLHTAENLFPGIVGL